MAFTISLLDDPAPYLDRVLTHDEMAVEAIRSGQIDELKAMVAKGYNLATNQNVLRLAIQNGPAEVLDIYETAASSFEALSKSFHEAVLGDPLRCAAPEVVHWLVKRGFEMDKLNLRGRTPLLEISVDLTFADFSRFDGKNLASLKALIQAGADVNARDPDYRTILASVIGSLGSMDDPERMKSLVSLIDLLLGAGADPCARDQQGASVLCIANRDGVVPMIAKRLLSAGALFDPGAGQLEKVAKKAIEIDNTELFALCVDQGLTLEGLIKIDVEARQCVLDYIFQHDAKACLVWALKNIPGAAEKTQVLLSEQDGIMEQRREICTRVARSHLASLEARAALEVTDGIHAQAMNEKKAKP